MKSHLSTTNYMGFKHMLSTCLTIILTQIWHLAATLTCVGMMRWSQVNVLYYNYSTPGQTKAHAVLYPSQECVHNSIHMPRFCLPIMRQKKGIQFYSSALVERWTSVSLKCPSNELFLLLTIIYDQAVFAFWPCALKKSPYLWSLHYLPHIQNMLSQQSRLYLLICGNINH